MTYGDRVEAAARALAREFDYERVFEGDAEAGEMHSATYWRGIARVVLTAAGMPEPEATA